ncbi:hypothetical protein [Streptomyces sp. SID161]|uniref:hypothetical protein n=1 Tax=unclassified Streptomyces TaxID=2593676 RepID=UPI00136C8737|nr:hypothetical protein [Streptomyces sp. SID161]MYW20727.1 hypothetical protein [Streptomyces sp. SID2955]MYW49652.1 hypothetical protein [Streptomyces sp. SID161]
MMTKLLATAALTVSAAALAAPAHADDHWTATGTAMCAGAMAAGPVVKTVSPLPLTGAATACGKGSLLHHGR